MNCAVSVVVNARTPNPRNPSIGATIRDTRALRKNKFDFLLLMSNPILSVQRILRLEYVDLLR